MANKAISRIELILQYYTKPLGKQYNAYRNHVYRVYHLTLLLAEKDFGSLDLENLAIASACQELGFWTHRTLDYLQPSEDLAENFMTINGAGNKETVALAIRNHHQMSKYAGSESHLVEPFRKADLIDTSMSAIRFGLPKKLYLGLCKDFPYLGFHTFIFGQICKRMISNPLRPLPMIQW